MESETCMLWKRAEATGKAAKLGFLNQVKQVKNVFVTSSGICSEIDNKINDDIQTNMMLLSRNLEYIEL